MGVGILAKRVVLELVSSTNFVYSLKRAALFVPDPSYVLCPFGKDHPSIAMVFFVSTAFASFFGMLSFRIPSSNLAFTSSSVTASPT